MAILKNGSNDILLKELSGKIGDIVIRQKNGKTIIAAKPKVVKKTQSPACILARRKWVTLTKFAKFIKDIPELKSIWKTKNPFGNAYNTVMKFNYYLTDIDYPTIRNTITPPPFNFLIRDIVIYEDNISIIMSDWFEPRADDKLIVVMALLDSKESGCEAFYLMDISPEDTENFIITLSKEQQIWCTNYKRFIIYTAIIRQEDEEMHWSNTVVVEGDLD